MSATTLDSATKEALRKTIRRLRSELVEAISEAAEGEYRLSVGIEQAKLSEAPRKRRERLEAWLAEQVRTVRRKGKSDPPPSGSKSPTKELKARFLQAAVKEAAHTLINRVVFLRILEHQGLRQPAIITGGQKSQGYREFSEFAPALCDSATSGDETQGLNPLLQVVFDELALDLPGLFGPVGLTALFPIPPASLRAVVDALNDDALQTAWGDDTTLGWVYQFWNDPDREALDDKLNDGGKVEPHEIASKTQMFTERYMVEWLLQNSLGQTWLALCKKNGWKPDFEQVRETLETRRAAWRKKREAGEVPLDVLMPLEGELEEHWKYWVQQPQPQSAVEAAPATLTDLKLLDPACGSGHFLVIAFDLLAVLYLEEARHRKVDWSHEQIAEWIVERNLHGIDIDPRAVQIAAAALWLKAKQFSPKAQLSQVNLVAPAFRLAALPKDDPAREHLEQELQREVGIPRELTASLIAALAGVDHLGSLLRVDRTVELALNEYDQKARGKPTQGDLFKGMPPQQLKLSLAQAKLNVLHQLGVFLAAHANEQDLGLRLEGEQLAAGIRFVQIAQEGRYDIVVGNPPYQGTSKLAEAEWFKKHYPRGKADLYTCFLERGLELAKNGGVSALLTMRGWMFLSQFTDLRQGLIAEHDLAALADLGSGAFEDINAAQVVVSVSLTTFHKGNHSNQTGVALQPTPPEDRASTGMTQRKRAALLAQVGRFEFDVQKLACIEGTPLVYWWTPEALQQYANAPLVGANLPIFPGVKTGENERFLRRCFEVWKRSPRPEELEHRAATWAPYIKGASGCEWVEPVQYTINWNRGALELGTFGMYCKPETVRLREAALFFRRGIAFAAIGATFSARVHRLPSVFDNMAPSAFPADLGDIACLMNSREARSILASLNPGIHFQIVDVDRLPLIHIPGAMEIFERVESAFEVHESHREASVEFKSPGASPWKYAQDWAQRAVDRGNGVPLPPYEPTLTPPEPESGVSYAIGAALGRFGANGEGILTTAPVDALPGGILFLASSETLRGSLRHPAANRIDEAWHQSRAAILGEKKQSLEEWLRKEFFKYHKGLYENRPIYFPISSSERSFVAYISIHRWSYNTLRTLLADHLHPALRQLEGEINDLNKSRASSDKQAKAGAEKQYSKTKKVLDELQEFIAAVTACAEKGAPQTDAKCPPRAKDAPFHMDLDDGVMINSAALWPLLEPQWKDPKKWWKELCTAEGRKDYDWAHLAARYFPTRVDEKCRKDPSLGVAHHCFWKYHPEKAHAWELRLQDEIKSDFTIDEAPKADPLGNSEGSDVYRARFLTEHPAKAEEIRAKEMQRRERKQRKADNADESAGDGEQESLDLEEN